MSTLPLGRHLAPTSPSERRRFDELQKKLAEEERDKVILLLFSAGWL